MTNYLYKIEGSDYSVTITAIHSKQQLYVVGMVL